MPTRAGLTFMVAVGTVTGSHYLTEVDGVRIRVPEYGERVSLEVPR